MPAQTTCPLCGGRLSVYQDSITRGQWHYCFSCKSAGELTELAAAVWQVSLPSAIRRLAAEGLPLPAEFLTDEYLERYVQDCTGFRKLIETMWKRSQDRLVFEAVPAMNVLRSQLGLTTLFSRDRVQAGPARLFGIAPDLEVERCFTDLADPRRSAHALFRGPRGHVLVIPHQSAPRRIGAFTFVTAAGQPSFRLLQAGRGASGFCASSEVGLVGLDLAVEHTAPYVVGVSDPLLMLRIQVKNFHSSLNPLPLVAWHDGRYGHSRTSWAALDHKQVILWAPKITPALLYQCQRTGARLVLFGPPEPTRTSLDHFLRQQTPIELMRHLVQKAKPWQEVVRSWLRNAPENQVSTCIRELIEQDTGLEILRECDPKHPRLGLCAKTRIRTVHVDGEEYTEQGGRWYVRYKQRDVPVFPGVIEIERVVTRGKSLTYCGEIRIKNKTIPLRMCRYERDAATRKYLFNALLQAGIATGTMRNGINLIRLAMFFREPKIIKGKSRIGWTGKSFRFKHFSISQGKVMTHSEDMLPANCPGPLISRFRCGKSILDTLGKPDENHEKVWAILISVLSAVTAAAEGHDSVGTVFAGSAVLTPLEAILARLGVPTSGFKPSIEKPHLHWRHKWPVYITMRGSAKMGNLAQWLIDSPVMRIMHVASLPAAYAFALHDLPVVRWANPIAAQAVADFPVDHALLAYLRYASGRHATRDVAGSPWERTCAAVAHWLDEVGVGGDVVRRAAKYVLLPGKPDNVARLATQLYGKGILTVDGVGVHSLRSPVRFDGKGLHVTAEQICEAIVQLGISAPALTGEILVPPALIREELEPWRQPAP